LSSEEDNKHLLDDCEKHTRRALPMLEELYGQDSEYYAMALNNLASFVASKQRFEEAEALAKQALHMFETAIGTANSYIRANARNLLLVLGEMEKLEERKQVRSRFEVELPEVGKWDAIAKQALQEGTIGPSPEEMEKWTQQWREEPVKKPLDLAGIQRTIEETAREMKQFVLLRENLFGSKLDGSILPAIKQDLNLITEHDEKQKALNSSEETQPKAPKKKKKKFEQKFVLDKESLRQESEKDDNELFDELEILGELNDKEALHKIPLSERYTVKTIRNLDIHKKKRKPKETKTEATEQE